MNIHRAPKFGAIATAVLLAACGGQAAPAAPASPPPAQSSAGASEASAGAAEASAKPAASAEPGTTLVHIATVGSISDAGFYLAADRGYLKEQGLSADFQVLTTGPQMMPLLATGQLDVAGGSASGALFEAIQRDIPLKIVADKGQNLPNFTFARFLARKDLADSGQIKGWADFKGKKVALSATNNSGQYQLYKALQSVGLTFKDLADVPLVGYPDQGAAFANKGIDASQNIEPFSTSFVGKDLAVIMPDENKAYDGVQAAVLMYGPKFVQEKPDIGKKLMVAYLKGVRDYNRAFTNGTAKELVINSLLAHTTVKERSLYDKMGLPGLNPDGLPNEPDITAQQDFFYSMGYQKEKIDLKPVFDHEFVDYAISQLGKYSG